MKARVFDGLLAMKEVVAWDRRRIWAYLCCVAKRKAEVERMCFVGK